MFSPTSSGFAPAKPAMPESSGALSRSDMGGAPAFAAPAPSTFSSSAAPEKAVGGVPVSESLVSPTPAGAMPAGPTPAAGAMPAGPAPAGPMSSGIPSPYRDRGPVVGGQPRMPFMPFAPLGGNGGPQQMHMMLQGLFKQLGFSPEMMSRIFPSIGGLFPNTGGVAGGAPPAASPPAPGGAASGMPVNPTDGFASMLRPRNQTGQNALSMMRPQGSFRGPQSFLSRAFGLGG